MTSMYDLIVASATQRDPPDLVTVSPLRLVRAAVVIRLLDSEKYPGSHDPTVRLLDPER